MPQRLGQVDGDALGLQGQSLRRRQAVIESLAEQ